MLCVLPMTSCSSECSNSTLKLVKNHLRSTMGNERLTGLIMMSIEDDPEKVISKFVRKHSRKLELQNIMTKY